MPNLLRRHQLPPAPNKTARCAVRGLGVVKVTLPAQRGDTAVNILIRKSKPALEGLMARKQLIQQADEVPRLTSKAGAGGP
jgi:hypothetical protein